MNDCKLVRDNIPQILEKEGKTCIVNTLELEDYCKQLVVLLDEKVLEFKNAFLAEDDELAVKKIADTVEVLYAVLDMIGVEHKSFEKIRLANKQKYGGYEKRILLKEVMQKEDVIASEENL